jgi:hypothetical protein
MIQDGSDYRHASQLAQVLRGALLHLNHIAEPTELALLDDLRYAYLTQLATVDHELKLFKKGQAQPAAQNMAALAQADHAIAAAQREIGVMRERLDAWEHGAALDTASPQHYRDMIALHEELLAEWRIYMGDLDRRVAQDAQDNGPAHAASRAQTGAD